MEFLERGQSPGPGGGGGAVLIRRERSRRGGGISIRQREPMNWEKNSVEAPAC